MGNNGTICIYCLEIKPKDKFSKEHVIPKCFGRFTPKNLILYETVCRKCNTELGNRIETFLCRDTVEGIAREKYGIKSKEPQIEYRRLAFRVYDGPKKGMILTLDSSDPSGETLTVPVLQAGFFHKKRNRYEYFELEDIPSKEDLEKSGYDIKNKMINIINNNDEERERMISALEEKGIDFHLKIDKPLSESLNLVSGQLLVKTIGEADRIVQRGFSKIAFNYLAYITEKGFCLNKDFSPIREFIRYDRGDGRAFIKIEKSDRVVPGKPGKDEVATHHWISIEWDWSKKALLCQLSLFGINMYTIRLCGDFKGSIWVPIKSEHFFDLSSGNIAAT